jgi:WS/DGAT/MGAT family acyltransferase
MTQLTGLDALFLHLETEDMPMHVGSLHLYEVPARIRRNFVERVRRHLAGRLHLCPTFTRRLAPTPMGLAPPAWIDDPAVDLEYHVRRVDLPAPGSREQLDECVAELHSRPLDRTRPLWEFHLIHGLPKGRVAFYAKVHHAAVDGQAGVALARAMLDTSPHPREVQPPPHADPAPMPDAAARLGAAIANQFRQSGRLLGRLPGLARGGSRFAGSLLAERLSQLVSGGADDPSQPALLAPRTPFNTTIDRSRAFACVAVPIADARRITAALGGTMNDVVLALCSGALRAWLDERGELPEQPLLAAVPMSLRAEGDTAQNTQATMVRIGLATGLADPLERFMAIREASESMKRTMQAVRSELPTDFPPSGSGCCQGSRSPAVPGSPTAAAARQPGDLQRAGAAHAAVPGWCPNAQLRTGLDRHPRAGAEHHRDELPGHDPHRAGGLQARGAGPAPAGDAAGGGASGAARAGGRGRLTRAALSPRSAPAAGSSAPCPSGCAAVPPPRAPAWAP